jgi:hypothetical protein
VTPFPCNPNESTLCLSGSDGQTDSDLDDYQPTPYKPSGNWPDGGRGGWGESDKEDRNLLTIQNLRVSWSDWALDRSNVDNLNEDADEGGTLLAQSQGVRGRGKGYGNSRDSRESREGRASSTSLARRVLGDDSFVVGPITFEGVYTKGGVIGVCGGVGSGETLLET